MSNIKLTVCIPMFNAEKTIARTLESINNSTVPVKIVIVDDHSVDASIEVVKKLGLQNVEIYSNEGVRGPGSSRNIGIEKANTEFITFCDADDIVTPEGYKQLLTIAERNNSDIVIGQYLRKVDKSKWNTSKLLLSKYIGDNANLVDDDEIMHISPSVCTKIFRLNTLNDNNIRFNNSFLAEDLAFTIKCQKVSKVINMSSEVVYLYKTETTKSSLITRINPETINLALDSLSEVSENLRRKSYTTFNYIINNSFRFLYNKCKNAECFSKLQIFEYFKAFVRLHSKKIDPFLFYQITGFDIDNFLKTKSIDLLLKGTDKFDSDKYIEAFDKALESKESEILFSRLFVDGYLLLLERKKSWGKISNYRNLASLFGNEIQWIANYYFVRALFLNKKWERCISHIDELVLNKSEIIFNDIWYYYAKALLSTGDIEGAMNILDAHESDNEDYWNLRLKIEEKFGSKNKYFDILKKSNLLNKETLIFNYSNDL